MKKKPKSNLLADSDLEKASGGTRNFIISVDRGNLRYDYVIDNFGNVTEYWNAADAHAAAEKRVAAAKDTDFLHIKIDNCDDAGGRDAVDRLISDLQNKGFATYNGYKLYNTGNYEVAPK